MRTRDYKILSWATAIAALFFLAVGLDIAGLEKGSFQEEMKLIKEKYGFAHWTAEPGKIVSGLAVSGKILPRLNSLRKVWPDDLYSLEKVGKVIYVKIRKWWRSGDDEFEVTMAVGPTFEDVKNYLIRRYAETQRLPPLIKSAGAEFGLKVGNVCFVTPETGGEVFSTIDFIRWNILFEMRAEGGVRKDLRAMAGILDELLLAKKPVGLYDQLPDLPRIKSFEAEAQLMKRGEKTILRLTMVNPGQRNLYYFWTMTGGGVEKDLRQNFIYSGSEEGVQQISVAVANDVGLYASQSITIKVIK
jgi:hypothetical protein